MNSLSSSSDCVCDDCFWYGKKTSTKSQKHVRRLPFYNTTQPLVYYAQVPPTCKRPKSREMRKSPNCFVKAFRWYTQEHVSPKGNEFSNFSHNMTEFAMWLDTKYQQFVQESQLGHTSYLLKLQQTTSLNAFKTTQKPTSKSRRKYRVKSPWRKRLHSNKESGDIFQKSHHSFEFILQPKEITRNTSEWCQPTPTSLRNRSNVTIVSTEVCNCKKSASKSLSLWSVQDNKSNTTFLLKDTIDEKKDAKVRPKLAKKVKTRNISCQCVPEIESKISTETQYEQPVMTVIKSEQEETKTKLLLGQINEPSSSNFEVLIKSIAEMPKKGTVNKILQEFDPRQHANISCQCTEEVSKMDACYQYDTNITAWSYNNASQETNTKVKLSSKQVKSALTNTNSGLNYFIMSIHTAVQTSDHRINLDNDLIQQYPFFMRIICADKLCDDCINR